MTADTWTTEQAKIPVILFDIMERVEYHVACADAPDGDRLAALDEIIDWCKDLKVTVRTGVPMADSDRFPVRVSDYEASSRTS